MHLPEGGGLGIVCILGFGCEGRAQEEVHWVVHHPQLLINVTDPRCTHSCVRMGTARKGTITNDHLYKHGIPGRDVYGHARSVSHLLMSGHVSCPMEVLNSAMALWYCAPPNRRMWMLGRDSSMGSALPSGETKAPGRQWRHTP